MRRVGRVSGNSSLGTDPFVFRAIADGARRCALCCYPRVIKNALSAGRRLPRLPRGLGPDAFGLVLPGAVRRSGVLRARMVKC